MGHPEPEKERLDRLAAVEHGADYLLAAALSFFFCFLSLTESFGLLVPFGLS